jgi:hypothetical protein
MSREKLIEFLLRKIEHGLIIHHEYDWYCSEDGTFCLFRGDFPGAGWNDTFLVGPYRTQLLAYSAYKRVGQKEELARASESPTL